MVKNNLIIVTGASSGIGKGCGELLLENGAYVIGIDQREGSIRHEQYQHHTIDIQNESDIISFIENIQNKTPKIFGLVNCAGVFAHSKPFYELTIGEWSKVLNTNLTGTFLLSKYIAREMIKNGSGKIVNTSCVRSTIFRPNMADYAASKGGVTALTSAMALDLAKYNIQVNAIAPGFTYTGMTAAEFDRPEVKKHSESIIPLGKVAQPADIAKVVLFLLSDMADYITGETIFVDGGFKIFK